MEDHIQLEIEYEEDVYSIRVNLKSELLTYKTISDIVHYILYLHFQKSFPREYLYKEFDGTLSTLNSYQKEVLGGMYYKSAFAKGTVIIFTYVFNSLTDSDMLANIIKITKQVFYDKRYLDTPYCYLADVRIDIEFANITSDELLVLYPRDPNETTTPDKVIDCNITFTNCNLGKVYVHPNLGLMLKNSEICLLGELPLEDCGSTSNAVKHNPQTQVYLSLHKYSNFINILEDVPRYAYSEEQVKDFNDVLKIVDAIEYPKEHLRIYSAFYSRRTESDTQKTVYLDKDSSILYINYCTGLGRIFQGPRYMKYKELDMLLNHLSDRISQEYSITGKKKKLTSWAKTISRSNVNPAFLWHIYVTYIDNPEDYFQVDLNYKPVINSFTLGVSIADLYNRLIDVEDF